MFRDDSSTDKVNLVVGVYQDEDGMSPVLEVVKAAEARLLRTERSKCYVPMAGEQGFRRAAEELVFGLNSGILSAGRVQSMHAASGTAALRIAAEFVKDNIEGSTAWISAPAYANHQPIFETSGLATASYRYYDRSSGSLTFDAMLADLEAARPGDVVLVHGCCHNPTGADLGPRQWHDLAAFLAERKLLPIVDLAYLGFAAGLEEDAAGLRAMLTTCPEGLVAVSFSKNFALYSERVGLLAFIGENPGDAQRCVERAKVYTRKMYSSPPSHGARIVAEVLADDALRPRWAGEVAAMAKRLRDMRALFAERLASLGVDLELFPAIRENRGMFALTGLTKAQVQRLRERHIYLLDTGRISIAGMRRATMDGLCAAIAAELGRK